jgi:2-polyprenyl-3-methyl-5-hydroxy-6-metoxy-1,4-benzoquinol methylase
MSQTDPNAQKDYWEQAGRKGYSSFMFKSGDVEEHVTQRMWSIAIEIGYQLGISSQAHVLELGCGDGAFANHVLAHHFCAVDGVDFAEAGIARAQAQAPRSNVRFAVGDLTRLDLRGMSRFDGAFLMGILHHVKQAAPSIIGQLREVAQRVVVLEPNGNHMLRKVLELTPSYRAAGEDSFRARQVMQLFEEAGFRAVVRRRLNLFPNFTPRALFHLLRGIEPLIESTPGLRALCTVNMFGFDIVDASS